MTDGPEDSREHAPVPDRDAGGGGDETVDHAVQLAESGTTIGPYRLIKQIGEGGMGVVYEAKQADPIGRSVALKIVKPEIDSDRVIARFEAERNALALMDHPHIAQVLDAGLAGQNRPYFVMELVQGLPITEFCDKAGMPIRERARLLVTVCRAVQHAHQKGIIHRDIKPSNVIVCDTEDGPQPKVIDFGVAKAVNAHDLQETDFTLDGHAVGTPLYMSPEQARLANSDIDTRSDIYSLGVLFYELLTGTTPILSSRLREMDLHDLRRAVRKEEPPSPSTRLRQLGTQLTAVAENRSTDPRSLIQGVRGDLDRIIGKAMAKNRNERYPTANGLARDIERYLEHLPIEATPPSAWYRLRRLVRRNRATFATILLIASILLISTLISLWQVYQKAAALQLARESSEKLSELLYLSDMKVASDAWKDADPARVAGLLRRHVPHDNPTDYRHFEWYFLSRLAELQFVELDAARDDIEAIRFSPSGAAFAVASRDGTIRIYDAATYTSRKTIDTTDERVNDVVFTADGQRLISAGDDGTLNIWNLATGQLAGEPIPTGRESIRALALGGSGNLLAVSRSDASIQLWDLTQRKLVEEFREHKLASECLAVSPDGWQLASASDDRTIILWDLKARKPVGKPILHGPARVISVAFSQDGSLLAAGDVYGNVKVYSVQSRQPELAVRQLDGVENIVFLSDDQWIAAGDRGGSIQFWPVGKDGKADDEHGQELFPRWQAHTSRVTALAVSPTDQYLISGSRNGKIRRWPVQLEPCRWSFGGVQEPVRDFAFVDQDGSFATLSPHGIDLWDLNRRSRLDGWVADDGSWNVVAASPSRRVLVTGDQQGQLVAWHLDTHEVVGRWSPDDLGRWEQLVFASDGHRFAAVAWERRAEVSIFDLDAPETVQQLPAQQSKCAAFSRDSSQLAVAHLDDAILFDSETGEQQMPFRGHSTTLSGLALSPDGLTLATVGHDRKLRLWDVASGTERYSIVAHRDWVRSVVFAPDGWSLITAGDDHVTRLWHVETGQLLMELPDEGHGILKAQFSPDGLRVVCLTTDNRIVVYDSVKPARTAE